MQLLLTCMQPAARSSRYQPVQDQLLVPAQLSWAVFSTPSQHVQDRAATISISTSISTGSLCRR